MKKRLYYFSPFILIPCLAFLFDFLDNINIIPMSTSIFLIVLAVICIVLGILSPTNKIFDYTLTIIIPLTLFCTMFILGFLDRGDSIYPEFSLVYAFEVAFQDWCLITYCIMALITCCASFRPFRIVAKQ